MQYDIDTKGDHVSIAIRKPGLPDDEEAREDLLHQLERAVAGVLDESGLNDDSIKVVGGHVYAQIEADCPECGNPLMLTEPDLGPENCAYAAASCECGWRGEAVYRLIDLHEVGQEVLEDENTDITHINEAAFESVSCVGKYGIRPMYTPY